MELNGKKAIVFGGTSGIGLAASKQLRDAGAEVTAVSRSPDKAGALEGVELVACDVRDRDALAALLESLAPYDILISAATGGGRALGPFMEMDLDHYQASFDKLWGYVNVVRLGTPFLADNGSILLLSGSPARRARSGQIALASVGAAVEQFVHTVASEIAPKRINVVSPGVISTPMYGPDDVNKDRMLMGATAKNAIPRPGDSDEVAQAIVFAAQNDFVTETTIDVDDGGWLIS